MVLHLSDSRPSFCETPSSNNVNTSCISVKNKKKHKHPRTVEDSDDQYRDELSRKKKKKLEKNDSETEASFVALITASNLHKDALDLPRDFTSSNGISRRSRDIVINDGGERSWTLDLRFNESSDTFCITRGWRSFCDENSKKVGGVFVFRLVANGETPLFSFCPAESTQEKASKGESIPVQLGSGTKIGKKTRYRNWTSPGQNRFVTLTMSEDGYIRSRQCLPLRFMRENGVTELRLITLVGKDGTKWLVDLRREQKGTMYLSKGWRDFAKANGLKIGEPFTLESIWEDETPMLSLICTDSNSDTRQQGEYCSKAAEKAFASIEPTSGNKTKKTKENREEKRDTSSTFQHRFVTLTLTDDTYRRSRLRLPLSFMRENGMTEPRLITLLGKDGTEWLANLRRESTKAMYLSKGWKGFAKGNGLQIGESFTLESICENGTPLLRLFSTESSSGTRQQGEFCPKASEDLFASTNPSSRNKTKNNGEEKRDSSSTIQHRFVTLTLTPEDVRDCKLILPSQFMKANGINKLGKITLLGKDGMKWFAYLLSKGGIVAMGCGWKGFCEANGVKIGESFTLECTCDQQDTTTYVFKFSSNS